MPDVPMNMLEKLDKVFTDINDIKIKVAKIDSYIEYAPKLDTEKHNGLEERFVRVEERVKSLEHSQIWAYRLIITTTLSTIVSIILTIMNLQQ